MLDNGNPRRPRFERTIAPPFLAHDILFSPDGRTVWVTSGSERRIALYRAGRKSAQVLESGAAPQHVTFARQKAFVACGGDGVVHRHRLDGERVREARVPLGSYNVTFGFGRVVTPSLGRGTVSLLDRNGRVRSFGASPTQRTTPASSSPEGGLVMKPLPVSSPFLALLAAITAGAGGANGSPYSPGLDYGWEGVRAPSGDVRYVTLGTPKSTMVAAISVRGGRVLRSRAVRGFYGVPLVAYDGTTSGLSGDGRTLVLATYGRFQASRGDPLPRAEVKTLKPYRLRRAARLLVLRRDLARRHEALPRRAHPGRPEPALPRPCLDLARRACSEGVIDRLVSKAIWGSARRPGRRPRRPLGVHALCSCQGKAIRALARHRPEAGLLHRPSAELGERRRCAYACGCARTR